MNGYSLNLLGSVDHGAKGQFDFGDVLDSSEALIVDVPKIKAKGLLIIKRGFLMITY